MRPRRRPAPFLVALGLGAALVCSASTSASASSASPRAAGDDAGTSVVRATDPSGDVAGQDEVTENQYRGLDLTGLTFRAAKGKPRLKLTLKATGGLTGDPFGSRIVARVEFTAAGDRYRGSYKDTDDDHGFYPPLEVYRDGRWRDACSTCSVGATVSDDERSYTMNFPLSDLGHPRRITFTDTYTFLPGTDRGDDLPGRFRLDVRR